MLSLAVSALTGAFEKEVVSSFKHHSRDEYIQKMEILFTLEKQFCARKS